jgi:hypothetical protein
VILHDASDPGASGHPRVEAHSEVVPHQVFLDRDVHQIQHLASPSGVESSSFGRAVVLAQAQVGQVES